MEIALIGNVAPTKQFYEYLILQQSAEVLTEIECRALHKSVVNYYWTK